MKTCAVIMTAFESTDTILEAIYSLTEQSLPDNWQVKFYIGVDSCDKTATLLNKNNISYYYAKENVGTYILSNSLIRKAYNDNCDIFVRFDSDDYACEEFLYRGIKNTDEKHVTTTKYIRCDEQLQPLLGIEPRTAKGSIFISRFLLEKIGGYHHYRVSCDKYLLLRIKALGYKGKAKLPPTYWYRTSATSLTGKKDTGLSSSYRENINLKLEESLKNKEFKINPVITDLEYQSNKGYK